MTLLYLWYASFVRCRKLVFQALSGIDVRLQKRGRLICNIFAIVKRLMSHEAEILQSFRGLLSRISDSHGSPEPNQVQSDLTAGAALTRQIGRLRWPSGTRLRRVIFCSPLYEAASRAQLFFHRRGLSGNCLPGLFIFNDSPR